ncbi:hypothetical protein ACNKHW_08265 [Shigella flexneri]
MGGVALFGASVVGQGVQWTMNAWQTQRLGGAGWMCRWAFIIGAGVGSVVTELAALMALAQRGHERDEGVIYCIATARQRPRILRKLAQQAEFDQVASALQRWYASIDETQNDREVVSLYAHRSSQFNMPRRAKSAVRRRNQRQLRR